MRRRPRPRASDLQKLEALLRDPTTYAEGEAIPIKHTGRRRKQPPFMLVVYQAAVSIYHTAREVETQFEDPRRWRFMRHIVKSVFPDRPEMWLPAKAMTRGQYLYGRRYLTDPAVIERRRQIATASAVELARSIGMLDPDGPGSITRPETPRMPDGDGKVIEPAIKGQLGQTRVDPKTQERVQVRYDPDAGSHREGGGAEEVYGTKFLSVSVRNDEDRVMLDVRYVPFSGEGGEAGVALESFASIHPLAPGVIGVIWDMAVRGVHIDRIMRELGWLTVTGVAAKEHHVRRGQKGGRRVEKERLVEVRTVKALDGTEVKVRLLARRGALGISTLDEDGNHLWEPLERLQTIRRRDKGGFRFYNRYRLPPGYVKKDILVRLHGDASDARRKLNRAENLRAIPPGDPDFDRLYSRRSDAESLNDEIERSLYLKKAHSIGHLGQESDLLGFMRLHNALVLARRRVRERLQLVG
ncbi:MAG: hypothetical protein M3Q23_10610 [Actinomycetota bacterium]|nr:hypothetical protein [Actinomycetota bacterium]